MLALDKEQSQHSSMASASVDVAEMCLMTPPRQSMSNAFQWTPTANLKLLLKAASPDLHSREMLNDQHNLREVSQSEGHVTVSNISAANDCNMHSNADMMTADEYVENVSAISVDKRRRKDKSLGSLCER